MLFHTWPFAIFLAIVLPGYLLLRRTAFWRHWLLLASCVFYGWWNPYYLVLIFYTMITDFVLVRFMARCPSPPEPFSWRRLLGRGYSDPVLRRAYLFLAAVWGAALIGAVVNPENLRPFLIAFCLMLSLMAAGVATARRKVLLAASLVNGLGVLAFFKYADFLAQSCNTLLARFGVSWAIPEAARFMPFGFEYLLPVGISFYTFQSLSYTIDYYRGNVRCENSFVRYATFVSFFPQLVAGPIERAKNLLHQFDAPPPLRRENLTEGLSLFLVGLFKKLALADYLALYVERIYDNPGGHNAPALLLGTFAFAWQIYCDFSGYTDMARGVARIFGFHLMLNFNHPYTATSLGDFWSRWHISLSTWFRDYVYIPLGGNRRGVARTYGNLFITFVVSGLWHGAAWTFVIWGALHAFGVMATREFERSAWYREQVPRFLKRAGVFLFTGFAWIFFRAGSLEDAGTIVHRIFTTPWTNPGFPALMLGLILSVWAYQLLWESRWRGVLERRFTRIALAVSMLLYLLFFSAKGGSFIYFQF